MEGRKDGRNIKGRAEGRKEGRKGGRKETGLEDSVDPVRSWNHPCDGDGDTPPDYYNKIPVQ